jgi:hypothetical protein
MVDPGGIHIVDYSEECSIIKINIINDDSMRKQNTNQKPNAKKKPQHTLKEKRQAKKEKAEGKPLQIMPR